MNQTGQTVQTVRMAPLDNLGMRMKLIFIAAIAAVPSVVLLFMLVRDRNKQLEFWEREYQGSMLVAPTRELYDHIVHVCLAATDPRTKPGDRKARVLEFKQRIGDTLSRLELLGERSSNIDVAEDIFRARQETLRTVSAFEADTPAPAGGSHLAPLAALRALATQVGNRSNLVLDPDLGTYYMVDLSVIRPPDAVEALMESNLLLREAERTGNLSSDSKTRLIVLSGRLKSYVEKIATIVDSSASLIPSAQHGKLQERLGSMQTAVQAYLGKLDSLDSGKYADAGGKTDELGVHALEATIALWDAAAEALGFLLNKRISDNYYEKTLLLGLVSTLFLLSFVLVVYVSGSISRRVGRLSMIANRIASQSNVGPEDQESIRGVLSRDEIGVMAEAVLRMSKSINQHIGALERARNQLEDYTAHLQQKIDERTVEIAQKRDELQAAMEQLKATQNQLIVSEKMASLGGLTAGIAHEIKNPLNFVNNFADLSTDLLKELQEVLEPHHDKLDQRTREDIEDLIKTLDGNLRKIHEHGNRADSIVKGMLAHSRGKSGERATFDANALLKEYVNLAFHGMRAKNSEFNIDIQSDYDPAAGEIAGVAQDLSRVFLNIVNNGCYSAYQRRLAEGDKFSPVLRVSTKRIGNKVEFRIRDNGKGIPKEYQRRIFEPFYTTKPTGEGTGLGLSISWDIIVDQHRGTLEVESEPGQFAEFIITLPAEKA